MKNPELFLQSCMVMQNALEEGDVSMVNFVARTVAGTDLCSQIKRVVNAVATLSAHLAQDPNQPHDLATRTREAMTACLEFLAMHASVMQGHYGQAGKIADETNNVRYALSKAQNEKRNGERDARAKN